MSPMQAQARIVEHPFAYLMQGARLDSYTENGHEIVLNVDGLEIINSELFEHEGRLFERGTSKHAPLKLSFLNVTGLNRPDFFKTLENYPADDSSRIIAYMYSWKQPGMDDVFYVFSLRGPVNAHMNFFATEVAFEQGNSGDTFTFERDWSPAPPMPDGLVPQPIDLYNRFGGDPVKINMAGNIIEHKLFVGGLENQPATRPQEVDAVLNLGERPSVWVRGEELHPNDRTVKKGEGSQGMSVDEIRAEANWVIERLQKNESVLIHCVAGMNRSTTIGCAVLMLLEGLTAEQALERVREQHPWAKPDSFHWLALRWLEKSQKT